MAITITNPNITPVSITTDEETIAVTQPTITPGTVVENTLTIVSDAVITVNGESGEVVLTTDNINEGENNQYYTDDRVNTLLAAGGYLTSETVTSLAFANTTLTYTDEEGNNTEIDFASFLDDTNTFVTSASFNTSDGVLTLTKNDASTVTASLDGRYLTSETLTSLTFTDNTLNYTDEDGIVNQIDLASLLDDTDTYVSSAAFNTADGELTLTKSDASTVTVNLDGRYLTSFTETNDLTGAVVWANVPDVNITQSSVTQHQAALSITESQISDLGTYLVAADLTGYATEAYADQAEADAISTAALDATSKANTAETNAKTYTDNSLANLVDSAPATLDTLNELATALGDDPNFATTITNTLATKFNTSDFDTTADTWLTSKEAAELLYSNVDSDLEATNVKGALDELDNTKVSHSELVGTLNLYPTDTASGVSTYYLAVDSVDDSNYDTTPVDIVTPAVTANNQLVGAVVSDEGVITGNPGYITIHTTGNIRKTSGGTNQVSGFYFTISHRTSGGTETLMGTSSTTPVITSATYEEFHADCLITNPVTFTETDRVVIKYYSGNYSGSGSPVYNFQFGGTAPVRTNLPLPVNVLASNQNAAQVSVDTTNFNGHLSGSDTTVQAALETLDDLVASAVGELNDLTDVNTAGVTDTQVLAYNGTSLQWEPRTVADGADGEDGIVVSNTAPTNLDVLWMDTTATATPVLSDITGENLADLADVSATLPTAGQALVWNNSTSVWEPGDVAATTELATDTSPVLGGALDTADFSINDASGNNYVAIDGNLVVDNSDYVTTYGTRIGLRANSTVGQSEFQFRRVNSNLAGIRFVYNEPNTRWDLTNTDNYDIYFDNLKWPGADGTTGQVLTTDGAGNLSFTTPAGGGDTGDWSFDGQVASNTNGHAYSTTRPYPNVLRIGQAPNDDWTYDAYNGPKNAKILLVADDIDLESNGARHYTAAVNTYANNTIENNSDRARALEVSLLQTGQSQTSALMYQHRAMQVSHRWDTVDAPDAVNGATLGWMTGVATYMQNAGDGNVNYANSFQAQYRNQSSGTTAEASGLTFVVDSPVNALTGIGSYYCIHNYAAGDGPTDNTNQGGINDQIRENSDYYFLYNRDNLAKNQIGTITTYQEEIYDDGTTSSTALTLGKNNGTQTVKIKIDGDIGFSSFSDMVTTQTLNSRTMKTADTVTFIIEQDAIGGHQITNWPANCKFAGGVNTIGTTAGSVTIMNVTAIDLGGVQTYLISLSPEFV